MGIVIIGYSESEDISLLHRRKLLNLYRCLLKVLKIDWIEKIAMPNQILLSQAVSQGHGAVGLRPSQAENLLSVAQSLEASFLEEMLKIAGVGKTPESFGGGAGEDQFASFLRHEQAEQMTKAGGIGLAQALFDAMKEHIDD